MKNAKVEFLEFCHNKPHILCAWIGDLCYEDGEIVPCANTKSLKLGYTNDDYNAFLDSIDFEYNNSYGSQQLTGTIWFMGGSWADRGEYDGSEWWRHNQQPIVPISLYPSNI